MPRNYDPRTEQLLALLPAGLTTREYAMLALACSYQAGLSAVDVSALADVVAAQDVADAIEAAP